MIDILDVYKAIDDGQSWATVVYIADQLPYLTNYKALRQRWLEYSDIPPIRQWLPIWEFESGDFIDTRDDGSNPNGIFDPIPGTEVRRIIRESREHASKTSRDVLRDSEEGI